MLVDDFHHTQAKRTMRTHVHLCTHTSQRQAGRGPGTGITSAAGGVGVGGVGSGVWWEERDRGLTLRALGSTPKARSTRTMGRRPSKQARPNGVAPWTSDCHATRRAVRRTQSQARRGGGPCRRTRCTAVVTAASMSVCVWVSWFTYPSRRSSAASNRVTGSR